MKNLRIIIIKKKFLDQRKKNKVSFNLSTIKSAFPKKKKKKPYIPKQTKKSPITYFPDKTGRSSCLGLGTEVSACSSPGVYCVLPGHRRHARNFSLEVSNMEVAVCKGTSFPRNVHCVGILVEKKHLHHHCRLSVCYTRYNLIPLVRFTFCRL